MGTIKVNPEQLRTEGKKLGVSATTYDMLQRDLYTQIDNLSSVWKAAEKDQYVAKIYEYKENIRALGKTIQNYGIFLHETANNVENMQGEIANAAGRL